jgi:hypothetical protein
MIQYLRSYYVLGSMKMMSTLTWYSFPHITDKDWDAARLSTHPRLHSQDLNPGILTFKSVFFKKIFFWDRVSLCDPARPQICCAAMYPRLTSNLWSSCLHFIIAGITGVNHHTWKNCVLNFYTLPLFLI